MTDDTELHKSFKMVIEQFSNYLRSPPDGVDENSISEHTAMAPDCSVILSNALNETRVGKEWFFQYLSQPQLTIREQYLGEIGRAVVMYLKMRGSELAGDWLAILLAPDADSTRWRVISMIRFEKD